MVFPMYPAVILVLVAIHAGVAVAFYRSAVAKGRSGAWALFGFTSPIGWLIGYAILSSRGSVGEVATAEDRAREEEIAGMSECQVCGAFNSIDASACFKCRAPMPVAPA